MNESGLTLNNVGSQIGSFSKRTEEATVVDVSLQLEIEEIPEQTHTHTHARMHAHTHTHIT